jgi:dihydroorotate dehydrogenase (fumarate)
MISLETTYMGLKLKSPIIAGSSGLTKNIDNLIEIEKQGAGAVVLKSLFEEQIRNDMKKNMNDLQDDYPYPEAFDYISNFSKANAVNEYIELIHQAKEKLTIPVIASINCFTSTEWIDYARRFQDAGADAIELNVFILPSDYLRTADDIEKTYIQIVEQVQKHVSIPISLKIGEYFTSLAKTVVTFSWTGIKGIVLFNRTYSPDIDINNFQVTSTNVFSQPEEVAHPLRWIALLSDKAHCDLSGSTGVHDGKSVVKLILVGAASVQVCSVLYKKKFGVIAEMNNFISDWMQTHHFQTITDFKGKMSYKNIEHPAAFERVQFMKYFAGIE